VDCLPPSGDVPPSKCFRLADRVVQVFPCEFPPSGDLHQSKCFRPGDRVISVEPQYFPPHLSATKEVFSSS